MSAERAPQENRISKEPSHQARDWPSTKYDSMQTT